MCAVRFQEKVVFGAVMERHQCVWGVPEKNKGSQCSLREMRSKRKRVGSASHHGREMANRCAVMSRSMTGSNVSE